MTDLRARGGGTGPARLLALGAILAFTAFAWLLACQLSEDRNRTLDDSFITYVYARNLAEGHGLRFNPSDEHPTAGASSLLQVGVAATAIWLGVDPLAGTRATGWIALLSLPWVFAAAVARIVGAPVWVALWSALTAVIALAWLPESRWHLSTGMETLPYTAIHGWTAAWVAVAATRRSDPRAGTLLLGLVLLALLAAARPEGALLGAGTLAALALVRLSASRERDWRAVLHPWVPLALGFAGVLGAGLLAHWIYFDQPLPNSFYVKSNNAIFGSAGGLLPGGLEVVQFAAMRGGPLLLLLAAAATWLVDRATLARGALLLAPSIALVLLYARAIHEAAGGFRYEYPFLTPFILCLALLLGLFHRRAPAGFAAAIGASALCLPILGTSPSSDLFQWLRAPVRSAVAWVDFRYEEDPLARMGLDLADTGLGERADILLSGAGLVPYYSRFRATDWIGLNDAWLSGRRPLSLDEVWAYIDSREPDVVYSFLPPASPGIARREDDPAFAAPSVQSSLAGRGSKLFVAWDPDRVADMFYREMKYVRDHYVFGSCYELWGDWELLAYVRRDSEHRDAILRVLQSSRRSSPDLDLVPMYVNDPRLLGADLR